MSDRHLGHRFAEGFAYGDYEQSTAKKCTKREKFLADMDQVVPWQALIALIEPQLPQDRQQRRPPALSAGHHAAVPPDAAVVLAE